MMARAVAVFFMAISFGLFAEVPDGCYRVASNELARVTDSAENGCFDSGGTGIERMRLLMDRYGWTTNQVSEMLAYMATNYTSRDHSVSGSVTFDRVISAVPEFCGTSAVSILEKCIDLVDNKKACRVVGQYARLRGFGHAACAYYDDMLFGAAATNESVAADRFWGLRDALGKIAATPMEINRYLYLQLKYEDSRKDAYGALGLDKTKCKLWPGYATSSNRLSFVSKKLGEECHDITSNHLHHVMHELEALPPGTMQMLSTNQFYNVEE